MDSPAVTSRRDELVAARKALGLTQAEFAAQIDTPLNTLKQWEAGTRRTPGVAVVAARLLQTAEPSVAEKIASMLDGTVTAKDIARQVGTDPGYVYQIANRTGKKPKAAPRPKSTLGYAPSIARVIEAADGTRTVSELAAIANVSLTTVYTAARKHRLNIAGLRKKYSDA